MHTECVNFNTVALETIADAKIHLEERIISRGTPFSPATQPSQTLLTYFFQLSFSSLSIQCVIIIGERKVASDMDS